MIYLADDIIINSNVGLRGYEYVFCFAISEDHEMQVLTSRKQ